MRIAGEAGRASLCPWRRSPTSGAVGYVSASPLHRRGDTSYLGFQRGPQVGDVIGHNETDAGNNDRSLRVNGSSTAQRPALPAGRRNQGGWAGVVRDTASAALSRCLGSVRIRSSVLLPWPIAREEAEFVALGPFAGSG